MHMDVVHEFSFTSHTSLHQLALGHRGSVRACTCLGGGYGRYKKGVLPSLRLKNQDVLPSLRLTNQGCFFEPPVVIGFQTGFQTQSISP